ncbi:MAG: ABC transporter ATP-binding protein [Arenimonas sp.]
MISLENVSKKYHTQHGSHIVLNNISLQVQKGEKIGILGRNGAGKSTLIRLLSGTERPDSGVIRSSMAVSWPLAFNGGFQGSLTGLDNVRFISRVYGVELDPVVQFVEEFADLGIYFREPVKKYSSGMRARLAFAISMAIEFDCYLIDEVLAVGDTRFHEKCEYELFEKRKDRSMIIVSHIGEQIKSHCDTIYVLHKGSIKRFNDINEAYEFYNNTN